MFHRVRGRKVEAKVGKVAYPELMKASNSCSCRINLRKSSQASQCLQHGCSKGHGCNKRR